MAGLLYFIDGKDRSIKLDEIHKLGLDYAFDKQPTPSGVSGRGPSGSAGVVLADPKRVPTDKIGYYLDKQTWLQMPGKPVWVGFYTDDRPKAGQDEERVEDDGGADTPGVGYGLPNAFR